LPAPLPAAAKPKPQARPHTVEMIKPRPRPALKSDAPPEQPIDLSHAMPGRSLAKLPSSAAQLQALTGQLREQAPAVAAAKQKSDALSAEAASLRQKLIDTAARIDQLERDRITQQARIAELQAEDSRLSIGFQDDRVAVTRLLAVLERLQHDLPPTLALKPDDALGAVRGSMLIGASLPPVYARAAALSRRIAALERTRAELNRSLKDGAATQAALVKARVDLTALVATKQSQAEAAGGTYAGMKARLDAIAREAADFQTLLTRIAHLRKETGNDGGVVTVEAPSGGGFEALAKGALRTPVVGTLLPPGSGSGPGATYATLPGALVSAPADGKVLFAGPYHKSGYVLILEITSGYDLVLAGLGQVTVRANDELLAGEPVGVMPETNGNALNSSDGRLYFELRRDGKGLDPAPWLSLELRKAKK
jgi:septal ring factor EnvC (AmiA/AmiB activator)